MDKIFFIAGAISAGISVAAGAFGAHGLRAALSAEMMNVFEIGVRYQMYHALALLAAAWACSRWPGAPATAAGFLFLFGTVVFSGSLYLLSISGVRWLGAITPVGGLAFIAGWACLAWAAARASSNA